MYDCTIVGAGVAGATAAYHLAQRGHSVVLLEKAALPRYKACGGGVSPAIATWFDFDFSPAIAHKISQVCYTWQGSELVKSQLAVAEPMWMVSRAKFDTFLVEQAQKQGAEIRDGVEVTDVKSDRDAVAIATSQETLSAKYVVLATGLASPAAKWLGLKERKATPGAVLEIETSQTPGVAAHFEFGRLKNGFMWSFPKANGYALSAGAFRAPKIKPEELHQSLSEFAAQLGLDRSLGKLYEMPMSLWAEGQPGHGKRGVLVGDALGVADPLTGEGIRPSILSGYRAAIAIEAALLGNEKALAEYSQQMQSDWGADMKLAQNLAGWYYRFPKAVYNLGIKRPTAAQLMSKILCGELRYSDIIDEVVTRLRQKLLPGGFGRAKN